MIIYSSPDSSCQTASIEMDDHGFAAIAEWERAMAELGWPENIYVKIGNGDYFEPYYWVSTELLDPIRAKPDPARRVWLDRDFKRFRLAKEIG